MTFPISHDQAKIPEQAPSQVSDLAERITKRRLVAEAKLAKLDSSFLNEPGYTTDAPLPLPFVVGIKAYLASPAIDVMTNWPPRAWGLKYGLQEAVEHFRFNNDDGAEALLAEDKVFGAIEQELLTISGHMPSSRQEVADWRGVLKACHRLRTDELFHDPMAVVASTDGNQDEAWAAIIVKLDESRPHGI